jgi:hypothetical protein
VVSLVDKGQAQLPQAAAELTLHDFFLLICYSFMLSVSHTKRSDDSECIVGCCCLSGRQLSRFLGRKSALLGYHYPNLDWLSSRISVASILIHWYEAIMCTKWTAHSSFHFHFCRFDWWFAILYYLLEALHQHINSKFQDIRHPV